MKPIHIIIIWFLLIIAITAGLGRSILSEHKNDKAVSMYELNQQQAGEE